MKDTQGEAGNLRGCGFWWPRESGVTLRSVWPLGFSAASATLQSTCDFVQATALAEL